MEKWISVIAVLYLAPAFMTYMGIRYMHHDMGDNSPLVTGQISVLTTTLQILCPVINFVAATFMIVMFAIIGLENTHKIPNWFKKLF